MGNEKFSNPDNTKIVDGWKEISQYLDRSEKTCRKWEKSIRLPVHRIGNSPKARVFAYRNELDEWKNTISKDKLSEKTNFKVNIKISPKFLILTIFITLILLSTGYINLRNNSSFEKSIPKLTKKPSVAILHFENHSGDENLDIWRRALAELISTDLSQSKYIRVLRSDEIHSILNKLNLLETKKYTLENIKQLALEGKVNYLLKGSFIKSGDIFKLTATLINTTNNKAVNSFSVNAEGERKLFPIVDELTKKIKISLNLSSEDISNDADKRIVKITTRYPGAYLKAIEANYYMYQADYKNAAILYKQALDIDPEFAWAHYILGNAYYLSGKRDEATECHIRALELTEGLPAWERYSIQRSCNLLQGEHKYPIALVAGKKLLEFYPDDFLGNLGIALIYRGIGEYDKALRHYQVLINNNDDTIYPYFRSSTCYQFKGEYKKAEKVLDNYLKKFPKNNEIRMYKIGNLIMEGKLDSALSKLEEVLFSDPNVYHPIINALKVKGDIFLYKGKLKEAEKLYRVVIGSEQNPVRKKFAEINIGSLYLLQGKFRDAEILLNRILKKANGIESAGLIRTLASLNLSSLNMTKGEYQASLKLLERSLQYSARRNDRDLKAITLYNMGLVYLKLRSTEKVNRKITELKDFIDKGMNKSRIRFHQHLIGMVALESNDINKAIDYFTRSVSLIPHEHDTRNLFVPFWQNQAFFIDSLAKAYFRAGYLDKAQAEYEKITALTFGRIYHGDIYAKAYYYLGRIYQQKKWKESSIDSFNKFIDLWKGCDPQFQPMVKDAEIRVKDLGGTI